MNPYQEDRRMVHCFSGRQVMVLRFMHDAHLTRLSGELPR